MSGTFAIEARGLTVGYRRRGRSRPVLSGLDLAVRRGELVCLIGPNGVGKTTLLRTLSGGQKPLAGTLRLGGTDAPALRDIERARLLGLVHTQRLEVGALSARRVVALGRYPHIGWGGSLGSRDYEVVHWAMRAVGVDHLGDRDVGELSDGERQRVNVARALAQQPAILLLDEPTAFLDVPSRVDLMGLLRRLAREEGLAVVASTHDFDLALRTADTIWLTMPDGTLRFGAPEDLVASGAFETAFGSESIEFRPDERTFRLRTSSGRPAVIRGEGTPALLAAAVLEREGWSLTTDPGDEAVVVTAGPGLGAWRAEAFGERRSGISYAALAAYARTLSRQTPSATEHSSPEPQRLHHAV